ncbi:hypothetical protein [Spiroplasma endosymbiont of Labia minor]|uniref:hypothetical protein n=1 Tax=Spiroplasma endosymbiont of Labia minor TaxID=3066305 RepID=UPI0030D40903
MTIALEIIAAIFFVAPFVIWGILRFLDKTRQQFVFWHKPLIIGSFIVGFILGIVLLVITLVFSI